MSMSMGPAPDEDGMPEIDEPVATMMGGSLPHAPVHGGELIDKLEFVEEDPKVEWLEVENQSDKDWVEDAVSEYEWKNKAHSKRGEEHWSMAHWKPVVKEIKEGNHRHQCRGSLCRTPNCEWEAHENKLEFLGYCCKMCGIRQKEKDLGVVYVNPKKIQLDRHGPHCQCNQMGSPWVTREDFESHQPFSSSGADAVLPEVTIDQDAEGTVMSDSSYQVITDQAVDDFNSPMETWNLLHMPMETWKP